MRVIPCLRHVARCQSRGRPSSLSAAITLPRRYSTETDHQADAKTEGNDGAQTQSHSNAPATLPNSYVPQHLTAAQIAAMAEKFRLGDLTRSRLDKIHTHDVGKTLTFNGWVVLPDRKLGRHLRFATLHDSWGRSIQLRFTKPLPNEVVSEAPVCVTGTLVLRPTDDIRSENLGLYELEVEEVKCFNSVRFKLPFQRTSVASVSLETLLRYRYLDLRYSSAETIKARAVLQQDCRNFLHRKGYTEVETPLLFKSTPEGAREFLVPTRRQGEFYALPQSPQQYKQLLMASGINKYFQFAKCFRDEDLRADRQPEFTQLDLEMAFSSGKRIRDKVEELLVNVFPGLGPDQIPFHKMTYEDAMKTYGTDKPDLRFPEPRLIDLPKTTRLRGFVVRGGAKHFTGSERKNLCAKAGGRFSHERVTCYVFRGEDTEVQSDSLRRAFRSDVAQADYDEFLKTLRLSKGDLLFVGAKPDRYEGGSTALGRARSLVIDHLVKVGVWKRNDHIFEWLWVVDFPLFSQDEHTAADPGQGGSAGLRSTHHPFTAPKYADFHLLTKDPLAVRAEHYDLVVNGVEVGGGSVRIHDADLQHYVLKHILKLPEQRLRQFDHLLEALASGCPPHAGIALGFSPLPKSLLIHTGFDRLVAMRAGSDSIRDVIAFPKTASGQDLLVGSPTRVDGKVLKEYHLTKTSTDT